MVQHELAACRRYRGPVRTSQTQDEQLQQARDLLVVPQLRHDFRLVVSVAMVHCEFAARAARCAGCPTDRRERTMHAAESVLVL